VCRFDRVGGDAVYVVSAAAAERSLSEGPSPRNCFAKAQQQPSQLPLENSTDFSVYKYPTRRQRMAYEQHQGSSEAQHHYWNNCATNGVHSHCADDKLNNVTNDERDIGRRDYSQGCPREHPGWNVFLLALTQPEASDD
ncbi:hypothetical protein FOZ62_007575, partial [Perkinsus olseni]